MRDLEEKYQVAFKSLMQLILNQYQNETDSKNELQFDVKNSNAKV